jgi:hypothetical protein
MSVGGRRGQVLLLLFAGVIGGACWMGAGTNGDAVAHDVDAHIAGLVPTPAFLGPPESGVPAKIEVGGPRQPTPARTSPDSKASSGPQSDDHAGKDSTPGQAGGAPPHVTVVPRPVFATQAPAARPAPPPAPPPAQPAPAPSPTDDHGRRGGTPDPSSHP